MKSQITPHFVYKLGRFRVTVQGRKPPIEDCASLACFLLGFRICWPSLDLIYYNHRLTLVGYIQATVLYRLSKGLISERPYSKVPEYSHCINTPGKRLKRRLAQDLPFFHDDRELCWFCFSSFRLLIQIRILRVLTVTRTCTNSPVNDALLMIYGTTIVQSC
jgi:hypothetical protein